MIPIPRSYQVEFEGERTPRSLAESLAAASDGTLLDGNAVEIVQDGAFFDRLVEDLAAARSSVHLENYLWKQGAAMSRVVNALEERARTGTAVRVIYDAIGLKTRAWAIDHLTESGAKVARHRRRLMGNLMQLQRRDHRKIAVIDGTIGWVFGHGIADDWAAKEPGAGEWRDTAVRLRGPVVPRLQTSFLTKWVELSGEAFAGPKYFPDARVAGSAAAHLARVTPVAGRSAVQRLYYSAIQLARSELLIQNPYFLPDRIALHHLREACRRGVSVRIMVPSPSASDVPFIQHGGHHFFGSLLEAGAEIHEFGPAGLHQKIMVVDREWCCVGSTNFDGRSLLRNDEIMAGFLDPAAVRDLVDAFERDAKKSTIWSSGHWGDRSRVHQMGDFAVALFRGQL